MPSEIILKIFSFLDPVSLLCIGCVNKRFYHLANDNMIWFRAYTAFFSPKISKWKTNPDEKISVQDKDIGYWKKDYIMKRIEAGKRMAIQFVKPINCYTGLPFKTKEAIKVSGLKWVIVLKDRNGKEHIMEQTETFLNDSSITVVWYGQTWPPIGFLSAIDLCGVTPVFLDRCMVQTRNGPRRRSLIAEYCLSNLSRSKMIGSDRLIQLFHLAPGLLVGLWKQGKEMAFVMANLHCHHLLERSILGSGLVPYAAPPHNPFLDDLDPQYGLRGYQLHIDLHSGKDKYLCGTFHNLCSRKDYIQNGYLKLVIINFKKNAQHLPINKNIGIFWKTDIFEGNVQNCCVMDVTLLDEIEKPFWCFSSPFTIYPVSQPSDHLNNGVKNFTGSYVDPEGRVQLKLIWMDMTEEFYIVNLVLYISIKKVNWWFGTNY
ncbi:F-box only protein 15 isoform X2 [Ornithorhynchus anatinus]|uniref:F-box protein 15 n=3 Tax=Ornithorhynchus anatinus TaxID=9258 RepID=A0A6I8NRM7_ORNAN|nr:F-box only protein 15 isoform X2 [Ornithorhynchus anatinus]XP_028922151.1 F-box only protein 15 isoform X2 [Ornithorhynchus anatinus]